MINYLVGMIFVFVYCMFVYLFGCAIDNNKHSAPVRFVIGYVIYSVIVGIGGIPIQFLKLSWMAFVIYMVLSIILITIFMIYRFKKQKIQVFDGDIKTFIKNYWFLVFISILLVFISIYAKSIYWQGNGGDDGYYLTRMATLPYDKNPFSISSISGIPTASSLFDVRVFNVLELENSVYLYFLNIPSTLFARCFLAFINYFFFACSIYSFAICITKKMEYKINITLIQYTTIIMILFSFPHYFLSSTSITCMRDIWQNVSANYFGSVLVRSTAMLLLITPFIYDNKITITNVVTFGMTSFMLMSKSTIAAPTIYLAFMVIALRYLFTTGKRNTVLGCCMICVCLLVGVVIGVNDKMISAAYEILKLDVLTYLFVVSTIIVFVFMLLRKKVYYQMSEYLYSSIILLFLYPLNSIVLKLCNYDFVIGRTFCTILITLAVFTWIIVFLEVMSSLKMGVILKSIISVMVAIFLVISAVSVRYENPITSIPHEIKYFVHNSYFVPELFVELTDSINELQETKDYQLNVISPDNLNVEGTVFTLSLTLRQLSPKVVSLAVVGRFPQICIGDFAGWDARELHTFDNFILDPSKANKDIFKKTYEKYPINCIISPYNCFDPYLEEFHLKEYKIIKKQGQYFKIYYRY